MKVYIGPYKSWIGPYQIADFFLEKLIGEDKAHSVGEWLSTTWVYPVCQWVDKKRKRNVKVRIDNYDTWSADHTLAHIILPLLKEIKKDKHGSPYVDDEDVPEHLRSTAAPKKENEWDTDDNHHLRWDYIIDQMIFSFENILDDSWEDKFHTGNIDWKFVPDENHPNLSTIVDGPNHTAKFNIDGYKIHQAKITKGLVLFGKYYQALWT